MTSSPALFEAITTLRGLKQRLRSGWVKRGVKNVESVAEHSWRAGLMAYMLAPEGYDRNKMLLMGCVHDLCEIFDEDYTPLDGITKEEKEKREKKAAAKFLELLPPSQRDEWKSVWEEVEARETKESKFVKEVEVLEMVFQALEYEKENNFEKDLTEFLETSRKRITHPVLVAYFNEIDKRWPAEAKKKFDASTHTYSY